MCGRWPVPGMLRMALIVATGVAATGEREILDVDLGDSEDEVFRKGFMSGLKQRGTFDVIKI
jgi:putative transposase